jgi:hypothetical protein
MVVDQKRWGLLNCKLSFLNLLGREKVSFGATFLRPSYILGGSCKKLETPNARLSYTNARERECTSVDLWFQRRKQFENAENKGSSLVGRPSRNLHGRLEEMNDSGNEGKTRIFHISRGHKGGISWTLDAHRGALDVQETIAAL